MIRYGALIAVVLSTAVIAACGQPKKPVTNQPDLQEYLGLITFSPPQGKNWYEVQRGDGLIVFKKDLGRGDHTFTASVRVARTGRTFAGSEDFLAFSREARISEAGPDRGDLLLHEEEIEPDLPAVCTRFHVRAADKAARWPDGMKLVQESKGYSCIHPTAPAFIITIRYTERHTAPFRDPALLTEGEQFIRSLKQKK